MTDLDRMELALRRVHTELVQTPRFAASDELLVLRAIIEELKKMNIERAEVNASHCERVEDTQKDTAEDTKAGLRPRRESEPC